MTSGPDSWTQLVVATCGPDSWTRLVDPICKSLKTRSCSRLDLWFVLAWEVFDSGIVPAWSLKNAELFWIGPKEP